MKKYILPILLLVAGTTAHAQSIGPAVLNAAGGSATIGGNTHEYAIATEVLGPTSSPTVTPGPLQPASNPESITDAPGLASLLTVFPNPAQTTVYIQPSLPAGDEISYTLADAAGKVVLRQTTRLASGSERQSVPLNSVAAGAYLLTIHASSSGQTATFNIQKTQ